MKKLLASSALLFLPLLCFSANDGDVTPGGLVIEWIDENNIKVSGGVAGPGGGGGSVVVYTNFFGTCTNCVNISPAELHAVKEEIISICNNGDAVSSQIGILSDEIVEICSDAIRQIANFVRYPLEVNTPTSTYTNYYREIVSQNYDFSFVHGKQGELTYNYFSHLTSGTVSARQKQSVAFSNGIYDYSNYVDGPNYSQIKAKSELIGSNSIGMSQKLDTIRTIVEGLSEDVCECNGGSCDPNGSGGGSGVSGDCPCKEQLQAIHSRTSDILASMQEQLQHLLEFKVHLASIDERLISFAEAFGSVFLNDSTIVVDTGANSWTNVYSQGYSSLYNYNHSNVLQRIELLLYGLAWPSANSSFTNSLGLIDGSDSALDSISSATDDASHSISEASQAYEDDVRSLGTSLSSLWDSMRFLGSGRLQNFALMEPTSVFDEYDLEFEFTRSADLSDLQSISRTAFQVFYLLSSLAFMILFWFKVVRFIYDKSLFVLDFFNKALT